MKARGRATLQIFPSRNDHCHAHLECIVQLVLYQIQVLLTTLRRHNSATRDMYVSLVRSLLKVQVLVLLGITVQRVNNSFVQNVCTAPASQTLNQSLVSRVNTIPSLVKIRVKNVLKERFVLVSPVRRLKFVHLVLSVIRKAWLSLGRGVLLDTIVWITQSLPIHSRLLTWIVY